VVAPFRYRHPHRGEAGFTLIEILVVLAVFGMLSLVLWSGLGAGVQGWSTGERLAADTREMRGMETILRAEIERAEKAGRGEGVFQGRPDVVAFVAWMPEAAGYHSAVRVGIGVDKRGVLVVRWVPTVRTGCQPEAGPPRQEDLARGVQRIRFSYYGTTGGTSEWVERWDRRELPLLVRVQIVFADTRRSWPDIVIRPILAGQAE